MVIVHLMRIIFTVYIIIIYNNDMSKIDFQHFKIYASISHRASHTVDARENFADMIYNNVNGIKAHALALKIYNGEGSVEYTDEEVSLMGTVAERLCVPGFIDGLREQLNNNQNNG